MKWLKRLAIVFVVLIAVFVVVGLLLPAEYEVERSVLIEADNEAIHTLVGDLRQWPEWTPWLDMDPTIETTFGEITTGVGAHQSWSGKSGGGKLTFTECDLETGIVYDMTFDEDSYESVGRIEYASAAGGVEVRWTMTGEIGMNPVSRYFGALMDMMVGPMFDKGLKNLKSVAESIPAPPAMPEPPDAA